MPRDSAACSRVKPPKKRSSTSLALSGSWTANCSRASCKASSSSANSSAGSASRSGGSRRRPPPAAVLLPPLAAGVLDEDAAHRLGGRGEEVPAIGEGLLLIACQSQVGLMHQGGGVERLPRLLLGQLLGRQPAQLVIDQREELL